MTTDNHNQDGGKSGGGVFAPVVGQISAAFEPADASGPPCGDSRFRYAACEKCANSVGVVNLAVNTLLMLIKGYLGVVGRSTALVADAIHSGADVISAAMLLFGLRIAKRPADEHYPYGYGKVEFLVAVVIYTSLISAGFVIFYDAITTILSGEQIEPSGITLFGAFISVAVNEVMFRQSFCAGKQICSPSMIANAWEKRSDALSSVAVLAGIAGAKLGFYFLDPAAAILVAFYIVKFSIEMLWEAFKGLMDTALPDDVVEGIHESARGVEGVKGIGSLRTREVGQNVWVDLEVLVDGESRMPETAALKQRIEKAVSGSLGRIANVVVLFKPVTGEDEQLVESG